MRKDIEYLGKEMDYARAYILPQVYENLYTIKDAFEKGTIFKDLSMPYYEKTKSNC